MTIWVIAAAALMIAGLGPTMLLAFRGPAAHRVLGLELAGTVGTLVLLVLSQAFDQSSYLILPLVLALLSFAGTLVFTRLLDTSDD